MNPTPTTLRPIVTQATTAKSGAETLGALINLKASDAEAIGGDLYAFAGRPADPTATPPVAAIAGKQPLYVEARVAHAQARAARTAAQEAGLKFAAQAVDTLKGVLGRRWNSQWAGVGFTDGSIAIPSDPLPTLTLLEAHYRTHAEHETAALDLTAVKAELAKQAIVTARAAANAARREEGLAKQARDAAFAKLRMRISLLREELGGLLDDDDPHWYDFGFRRPVDGQTPDLVDSLTLRLGAPGEVVAEWSRARLADNYRVSWKLADAAPEVEPTQVGLFADQQAIITGLPSGVTITVIVTARNGSGESGKVTATIAIP